MKDIKGNSIKTRHGLYARILALLLTLALCMGMMPVSALAVEAAEEESAVTLKLKEGNIVIEPDGYTQDGGDKVSYTGAYVITGSVTGADTPLLLKNETDSEVTYDITLDNASSTDPVLYSTAILVDGNTTAGIILNLTSMGESEIYASSFPAIYNGSSCYLTVNLYVMSGSLTLGNTQNTTPKVISNGSGDTLNMRYACTVTSGGGTFSNNSNTTFVPSHTCTDNGDGTHSISCEYCVYTEETAEPHTMYYADNGDGTHTGKCSYCSYHSTTEAHDEGTAEDCGDGHSHIITCSDCGAETRSAHTLLENGTVDTEPAEKEAGVYSGTCSVCGAEATSPIAPDGGYWVCLYDSFGDGWNGASLSVYVNGKETSLTLEDGAEQGFFISGSADDTIVILFHTGSYNSECSVELYAPGSNTALYSRYGLSGAQYGEILYSNTELADYSAVEGALDAVPVDLFQYTWASLDNLIDAMNEVIYYLSADSQAQVDAYAQAILEGTEALELCGEDEDPSEGALSLEIADGQRLIITSTGYRWGEDGEETAYTGAYSLTGGGMASVLVESGSHFIVTDDLSLVPTEYSPFAIASGASVLLCLEGSSYFTSGGSDYAGLNVPAGAALYIGGSGSLYATGGSEGAGIGGNGYESSGQINISGGTIVATGTVEGAGIGGGFRGNGGRITISGGRVTATGDEGAGIGSGDTSNGSGGEITISGGTVTATGTDEGAGIGGGDEANGGKITITGGRVIATSTSCGAGIGGGCDGDGGEITISGGTVTATCTGDGAGIGGGNWSNGGEITISGGTVTATGSYGAGIGGGYEGSGGQITISGGTITATGSSSAGIGGGYYGDGGQITISGGVVTTDSADGNIIGNGAENDSTEGETNFVIIDILSVFSDSPDNINPAPRNPEDELVFHQSIESERENGYVKATLSDETVWLLYVKNGEISLYLPDGVTLEKTDDPGADYTAVDEAIAEAEQLNKDDYMDFTGVEDAIEAVDRSLYFNQQDEVDAMAKNIRYAIDALAEARTLTFSVGGQGYALDENEEQVTSVKVEAGTTVNTSDYTARCDGYIFEGWYLDEALSEPAGDTLTLDENITLYAKFTEITYTLTFDTAGGSAVDEVTAAGNTQIDLSGYTTTRDGYTFSGWNTAADGTGTSYAADGVFTITEDITLYAVWTANQAESEPETEPKTEPDTGSGDGAAAVTTPLAAGQTYSDGDYYYRVTSLTDMTAEVVGQNNTSITKVQIYDTVVLYGESFTVTAVAAGAFKGNKNITSVTMKKNLVSIGANAFSGCTKLKTVTIGSTVLTGIGANAFSGCTSLKKVTIKSKILKSIGKQAFKGDKKLTRITLKTTKLKSVGKKALSGISAKCVIKVPRAKKAAYTKLFKGKGQKSTVKVK